MKVISYLATLPAKMLTPAYSTSDKLLTLQKYAEGVAAIRDDATVSRSLEYQPADVAVMLGWVHSDGKKTPHLAFRQHIVD